MTDISRLTSRKFLLSGASLIAASVLCWFGKIDGGVFAAVVMATVAGYITGNIVQKVTT